MKGFILREDEYLVLNLELQSGEEVEFCLDYDEDLAVHIKEVLGELGFSIEVNEEYNK